MVPPIEIHFFPFFFYSPNATDDLNKPKIQKKTNKLLNIHKLLIQSRNSSQKIPPWEGVKPRKSSDGDHHATLP